MTGRLEIVPHDPVYGFRPATKGAWPPAPDVCLACGVTQDAHPPGPPQRTPAPTEGG